MGQHEIIEHVAAFDITTLRESLSEAPDPPTGESKDEIIDSTIEWLDLLRGDLVALVKQIGSGEDVDMALAIQYVELKSRWIAFNTKMNYTIFKGGHPNVRDMCRAAAVSAFLGHIESLLRPHDIDHITDFLARPINEAA